MGRRSDSDEDRKKKKKSKHKSRSRSSSIDSRTSKTSKHKKSKKKHKHKSRSQTPDRSRSRRKSRSTSREKRVKPKSYQLQSRSPSPYKSKRKSRSRSRTRRSRSRSRSRTRRSQSPSTSKSYRSRSRSPRRWSRSPKRRSRSPRRRSWSRSPKRRSRSRSRDRSKRSRSKERFDAWDKLKMAAAAKAEQKAESEDPCASIPGFDAMTLSEQSEARLQMALKAAAAAGEKLKEQGVLSKALTTNFAEQQQRAWAIDSIENDSFTPAAFKSSHAQGSETAGSSHENAIFGLSDLTLNASPSSELRAKELQAKDTESLMHPNLYISSEDKMTNWIEKLTTMRRRKLEGSAMH